MLRRIILVATFIYLATITYAQHADDVLSKFFAVQLDETVFMRWTITAGNTCEDTYVERSADGISYERIGLIGGICGSPDQSITYEFTDSVPLVNRTSYYRLELGYYGHTSPLIISFTKYNEQGFLLAPNPFINYARLAFNNPLKKQYDLVVSDISGKIVAELSTTGHEFLLRRNNHSAGLYYFRVIESGIMVFEGKIVIQ